MEEADNMFKVDFFGEPMYLTPSSQFYLEISLPTLGNVFCVAAIQAWRNKVEETLGWVPDNLETTFLFNSKFLWTVFIIKHESLL